MDECQCAGISKDNTVSSVMFAKGTNPASQEENVKATVCMSKKLEQELKNSFDPTAMESICKLKHTERIFRSLVCFLPKFFSFCIIFGIKNRN